MRRLSNSTLLIICGAVGVLLLALGIMLFYRKDKKYTDDDMRRLRGSLEKEMEHRLNEAQPIPTSSAPQGGSVVLFYDMGCPHCKNMMGAWQQFKERAGTSVDVKEIEFKNASGQGVKGVPTVRYYPSGMNNPQGMVEYKGDRSAESLYKFAMTQGAEV